MTAVTTISVHRQNIFNSLKTESKTMITLWNLKGVSGTWHSILFCFGPLLLEGSSGALLRRVYLLWKVVINVWLCVLSENLLKSLHLKINQTDEMRVRLARSTLKCSVKLETKQNKSFINQLYYLQIYGDYGLHQSSRANYSICWICSLF